MEAAAFIDLRRRGTVLDDFVPVVLLSLGKSPESIY